MKVEKFEIEKGNECVTQTPFIRFSNGGCSLPECHCSPSTPWISISDGETGLLVTLSKKELGQLLQTGEVGGK